MRTGPEQRVIATLDVLLDEKGSITGFLRPATGEQVRFVSWLGLVAAIDELADREPEPSCGQTRDPPPDDQQGA